MFSQHFSQAWTSSLATSKFTFRQLSNSVVKAGESNFRRQSVYLMGGEIDVSFEFESRRGATANNKTLGFIFQHLKSPFSKFSST